MQTIVKSFETFALITTVLIQRWFDCSAAILEIDRAFTSKFKQKYWGIQNHTEAIVSVTLFITNSTVLCILIQ